MDVTVERFPSGRDACEATVLAPPGPGPHPVVILGMGLGGTRDLALDEYASRFADAGLATICFDYRGFGGSGGHPRQVIDIGMQLDDWAAAIAFARERRRLDPSRVALWGTSFAGGHVLEVARRDGDIAAVVAQVPFTDGLASLGSINPVTSARLMAAAVADQAAALVRRSPVYVPLYGPPGSVAMLSAPDCEEGYAALVPEGSPFENRAAARLALHVATYRPGRALADLTCPVLVCLADQDSVAPADTAARFAAACPTAEVLRLDCGHFDVYRGEHFETVVARQATFLVDALAP